jgi:hypothetical protein
MKHDDVQQDIRSPAKSYREFQKDTTVLLFNYLKLREKSERSEQNEIAREFAEYAVKAIRKQYPNFF